MPQVQQCLVLSVDFVYCTRSSTCATLFYIYTHFFPLIWGVGVFFALGPCPKSLKKLQKEPFLSSSSLRCSERASAMKHKINKVEFTYLCKMLVICHLSHATDQFLVCHNNNIWWLCERPIVKRRMENIYIFFVTMICWRSIRKWEYFFQLRFRNVRREEQEHTRIYRKPFTLYWP